ncbi:hypothetical protein DES39_0257 [Orbus hercynius]|uniref:Uncharacterized protein n=1 Tax=Orbus hercynius TaxID=593135 RepID=A0A495RJT4_9GAMM|nr:hypothetical protein [Orbus hercynius]RKS87048.1 hypothetical protein DES39_0257 [Orbus hercynius]
MVNDMTLEQLEVVLRKINWAQEILNSAQNSAEDSKIIDILSGISFIIGSASCDVENLYSALR